MKKTSEGMGDARIGLLGNPSDIYGGRCVSFTFDRTASVIVSDSENWEITNEWEGTERQLEYNGKNDLVKAILRKLSVQHPLKIEYQSEIPIGVGLAGSSAIIIATIKALNRHFKMGMDLSDIAELALYTEVDELRITAGFQDRYTISHGGLLYMDFKGKEYMRKTDPPATLKIYSPLKIPCFLAIGKSKKSSSIIHNSLRERFLSGDTSIKRNMDEIACTADKGLFYLLRENWSDLGKAMNANHNLRRQIGAFFPPDEEIINYALSLGALGAKSAGSGGAVLVLSEDLKVKERMSERYKCFVPRMTRK